MPPNPPMVLSSVDCDGIQTLGAPCLSPHTHAVSMLPDLLPHSAKLSSPHILPVYAKMLTERNWAGVSSHLMTGVDRLVKADCDLVCIASNTGHIAYPDIVAKYLDLAILHIADTTAAAIKAKGLKTVGLLGAYFDIMLSHFATSVTSFLLFNVCHALGRNSADDEGTIPEGTAGRTRHQLHRARCG